MWHWLTANYRWFFSGIGVLLIGLLAKFFLGTDKSSSAVKVGAPQLVASPVAHGDGNTQTPIQIHGARDVHIGHAPPTVPVVPAPIHRVNPERSVYNIRFIDAGVCSLEEVIGGGRFIERGSQRNAIAVRFANEPIVGGENRPLNVKAVLIYKEGEGGDERELLDIPGTWINGDRFEADGIRHKLIVGIVTNKGFTALEEREVHAHRRTFYALQPHLLGGFTEGTVFIRLTSSYAAIVLYEGYFTISTDPLSIVSKTS